MREIQLDGKARRIFGNVTFCKIINTFEKPVIHIAQEIETVYPERMMDTGFGPGLYDNSVKSFKSVRNTIVKVPDSSTSEEIIQKLGEYDSHIYSIVSNDVRDVLNYLDLYRLDFLGVELFELEDKYETQDKFGNRYSKGKLRMTSDGEIVDEDLPKEFRRYVYSRNYEEDKDLRQDITIKDIIKTEKREYKLII